MFNQRKPSQMNEKAENQANMLWGNIGSSIAERSAKFLEQKEAKQQLALKQKQAKEAANEELTFKPQINKAKRVGKQAVGGTAGLDKYMERVQKANKLKQEKKDLEQKVFGTGKNWTPQITQPNAPKLTVKKTQDENELNEDLSNAARKGW